MEPLTLPSSRDIAREQASAAAHSRKRFQREAARYRPTLTLDQEGTLVNVSPSARRLLEYDADETLSSSFFTHVHGKNLYRVMRDVADMVCYGKKSAAWLLRLRTGQGRWRWYRAEVTNHLDDSEPTIHVLLNDLNSW